MLPGGTPSKDDHSGGNSRLPNGCRNGQKSSAAFLTSCVESVKTPLSGSKGGSFGLCLFLISNLH